MYGSASPGVLDVLVDGKTGGTKVFKVINLTFSNERASALCNMSAAHMEEKNTLCRICSSNLMGPKHEIFGSRVLII